MKKYKWILLTGMIIGCFILYFFINKSINSPIMIKKVTTVELVKNSNSLNNSKEIDDEFNIINKDKEKIETKDSEEVKTTEHIKDEEKKVIVIDPGHASSTSLEKEANYPGSKIMKIKESGGAQGCVTNTPEYVINMLVAVKLKKELEKIGYIVIMTKDKNEIMLGNIKRAEIGNKANADLVLRIHADSNGNSSAKGASMLVPANTEYTKLIYEQSKKYGQIILNSVVTNVGMNNRGVIERVDMTGFNWSKVPVVLIEMGFLSNPTEDKLLCTEVYQKEIVKGIVDGINKIFN